MRVLFSQQNYCQCIVVAFLSLYDSISAQDCDSLRFEGCEPCAAAGCAWCTASAQCIARDDTGFFADCAFSTTCDSIPDDVIYTDPLVASQQWVYEMINVEPVWRAGFSKSYEHSDAFHQLIYYKSWKGCRHSY